MMSIRKSALLLAVTVAFAACADDAAPAGDAGLDLAVRDLAGSGDAAVDLAADPNDILGTLSGSCGVLAPLLHDPSPSLVNNALAFVSGEAYVRGSLSPDGQRLYDIPNAGGSSTESEVMSFEVLHFCDGARLLKSETEISYAAPTDGGGNSITDILVAFGGDKIGVSVTRAYKPTVAGMTDLEVYDLLVKKLVGIRQSSSRVLPADRWVKQILHVFVATAATEQAIARVLPTIDAATRADTIVLVTRTTGGGFIYCDPDPALGSECPLR